MKTTYRYTDQMIGTTELTVTVISMMMSVGILSLPRLVARETMAFDGAVSLLLTGILSMCFGYLAGKLVARFPQQTFLEFSGHIVGKPFSYVLTALLGFAFLVTTSFEIRSIANITKEYLFDKTPVEVIALFFLLVVVYAVSGSRVGLLRLNWLFLPPVLIITLFVQVMNISIFDLDNLQPLFITPWQGLMKGVQASALSFVGFVVVLPYCYLVRESKKIPRATVVGIAMTTVVYLILYLFAIGVFAKEGAQDILYPIVEIAKEVEVPGGFFERFESLFFTIWIMTTFNTSAMAFDAALHSFSSLFGQIKKPVWVLGMTPIIYFLAMLPKNRIQVMYFGYGIGYLGILFSAVIPTVLLLIAVLRKVKASG